MATCKYTAQPAYKEVEVCAKTVKTYTGSIDRKAVGRCLLTEAEGFGADKPQIVVDGDGTVIRSVKKVEEFETFVQLVDGSKSIASFKFYEAFTAANPENAGVTDLFTDNGEQIAKIENCARRMCDAKPECDGQWMVVTKDGKRVFLRLISKEVTASGMIEG